MTQRKRILSLGLGLLLVSGCDRAASPADEKPNPNLPALQAETLTTETLNPVMQPHWVWVNESSFDRPLDGRAYLVDADSGQMLGMVSGGYVQGPLLLDPDGQHFAQLSTFYSRGVRGERTDVITEYAVADLLPTSEVVIPPKTIKVAPLAAAAVLSDDGRFAIASNFTPAQSVTVVDRKAGSLVGEFPTPGCGLIYPVGERKFMVHCSDGALALATMDEGGNVTLGETGSALSPPDDPAMEKPVRIGKTRWLFVTFTGQVKVVDATSGVPAVVEQWSLGGEGWRPGGMGPMTYHRATGELYVLMHEGAEGTHKNPGTQVWVFDLKTRKRARVLDLGRPETTIAISGDAKPFLYGVMFGVDGLDVFDPQTGKTVRRVEQLGGTLSLVQPPVERW